MILRRGGAFVALALAALAFVPVALGSSDEPEDPDCVSVGVSNMVEGLRVIAYAGREIALGFEADQPGEGVGFVVYLAPSVCTGLGGIGMQASSGFALPPEEPSFPALP